MKILYRFLFLAVFLGIVPLSCERCETTCGCETPPKFSDFEITDMGIRTIATSGQTELDSAEYYRPSEMAIAITITDQKNIAVQLKSSGLSFSNMAYACDPIAPPSIQSIQNVEISAAKEVLYKSQQDVIQSGEMISDRFGFAANSHSFDSLSEFLSEEPRLNAYSSFYIQLQSPPFQPTTLIVNVKVTLSDGKIFTFENEILKVK